MAKDSVKVKNLCFVCCKRVHNRKQSLTPRQVVCDAEDSQSSELTLSDSEIFLKFVEFAKCYLKLETNEVDGEHEDSPKVEVFCKSCSAQVEGIFGLYEQFCEVEKRLSSRLVKLGNLMKKSLGRIGTRGKKGPGIRELIIKKCLEKGNKILQATGINETVNLSATEKEFFADDGDNESWDEEEVQVVGIKLTYDEEDGTEPEIISTSSFSCNKCPRKFSLLKGLNSHLVWHDKQSTEQETPCCFCYKTLILQQTQKIHLQVKHPSIFATEKPFVCDEEGCNASFATLSEVNEHVVTHDKPISYCSFCKWGFVSPDRLKFHEVCHTEPIRGYYYCSICNSKAESLRELQTHFNFKHGTKSSHVDVFECSKCGKRFRNKVYLKKHMLKKHRKNVNLEVVCDLCGVVVANKSVLQAHKRNHKVLERYSCHLCDGRFWKKMAFKKHLVKIHGKPVGEEFTPGEGLKFGCMFLSCGAKFGTESELQQHVDGNHTPVGESKFMCPLCGRVFASQSKLTRHNLVHSKKKLYKCHVCEKTFAYNSSLKEHLKIAHDIGEGQQYFRCEQPKCAAKFKLQKLLNYHVRVRHGVGKNVTDSKDESVSNL